MASASRGPRIFTEVAGNDPEDVEFVTVPDYPGAEKVRGGWRVDPTGGRVDNRRHPNWGTRKGQVVDVMAPHRGRGGPLPGGANAGHTVMVDGEK